jgi:preprotein translocase subunit YajC
MKFRVGDKVVGNKMASGEYHTTIQGWEGKVTKVYDDGSIRVKGVDNVEYDVAPEHFDLVRPEPQKAVKKAVKKAAPSKSEENKKK